MQGVHCMTVEGWHFVVTGALHLTSLRGPQLLITSQHGIHKQGMSYLQRSPVMERLLVLQLRSLPTPFGTALAALAPLWQHKAANPAARQVLCIAQGAMLPVRRQLAVVLLLEARVAVQQRLLYRQAFMRRLLLLGQDPHLVEGGLGRRRELGVVCKHRSRRLLWSWFGTQNKLQTRP